MDRDRSIRSAIFVDRSAHTIKYRLSSSNTFQAKNNEIVVVENYVARFSLKSRLKIANILKQVYNSTEFFLFKKLKCLYEI